MKKLGFFLVMSLPLISLAQNQFEIEGSYGLISGHQTGIDTDVYRLTDENSQYDLAFMGPMFITGRYYATNWISAGLSLGIDKTKHHLRMDRNTISTH